MPFTFIYVVLFFVGIFLIVLFVPVSIVLLVLKKKKTALLIFICPLAVLIFSLGMPLYVFGNIWIHDFIMNIQPKNTFSNTFGFRPDEKTVILEAYIKTGIDYETTLIKFRTTKDIIDKITHNRFKTDTLETFKEKYSSNSHNLPHRVQEWFSPSYEKLNLFYLAEPFDDSFSTFNEAILCYNEETGIAYFHWSGCD